MTVGDLLNLPAWQVMTVEEHEDRYAIIARPASCVSACPCCGSSIVAKHGTDNQMIRDLPCHAKYVFLHVPRQRYRCKTCKKTWFEPLPGVDERRFATVRLVQYIQRQSLTRTFVSVASDVGLDEKSIRNIFEDYIVILEQTTPRKTPRVMGIDELHLLGQARGMITDLEARDFVEMLPDRKKQSMIHYLANVPGKERVQICVIDMWRPYLEALQETLPHVTVVIDKFHVLKMLTAALETVRKEVRSTLSERQRRSLMHDRYILLRRYRDLDEAKRLILETWLGTFPRLRAAYECKEAFYGIYDATNQEEALERYFTWLELVKQGNVHDAFLDVIIAIENWGDHIFAYFDYRYTGGFVEAANGVGRVIDRQGRGYSFDVLRARLLYGQSVRQRTKKREQKSVDEHLVDIPASTLT